MIDTSLLVRLLRVTSGCILYFYVFTHLVNHSLGLIALETMEIGRSLFLRFWRHDVLFYSLYGALLIHFLLGIYALCRKRSFKMSKKEWIRNSCAVLIPFFLASHLSITLWGSRFLGLNDTYSFMILSTYLLDPFGYILLGLMLVVVWVHGSIGILGLLEFRKVYSDFKGFFHGIIFSLPLLAYGGYLNASIELTKVGESNPLAILEIIADSNFTKETGADVVWLSDFVQFLIYPALLSAILIFIFVGHVFAISNDKQIESVNIVVENLRELKICRVEALHPFLDDICDPQVGPNLAAGGRFGEAKI